MSAHRYTATTIWTRGTQPFTDNAYKRVFFQRFDGGLSVPGSSAPGNVPEGTADALALDPEEALVAALSSCHMLTFLAIAAARGIVIDTYEDEAVGEMTKNDKGKLFVSTVTLHPRLTISGAKQPDAKTLARLHHLAHEECYIANSVKTEVIVAELTPLFV
jgi:organic hydroperoxide reductase OsmC/OhrA